MSGSIEIPKGNIATAEAELLVFVLDGSGSMTATTTFDGKPKVEHLESIMVKLLDRLSKSSKAPAFRVAFVYFSESAILETGEGRKYFPIDEALKLFSNPVAKAGGRNTAIADALETVGSVLDDFTKDEGIPSQRHATVFLLTDGQENMRGADDVREAARIVTSNVIAPTLATISFGVDADEILLKEIASRPSERQIRHLDMAQVLSHLPDVTKLFIQGHADGKISEEKAEALRSFVETLSETEHIKNQLQGQKQD